VKIKQVFAQGEQAVS